MIVGGRVTSAAFETIERGTLPDGTSYRVARRLRDGWTRCFVEHSDGRERRRSMGWLRKARAGVGISAVVAIAAYVVAS